MQLKNNVTCLYTFLLNFPQFSNFFLFSAFCMKNVKQVHFDQCLECAAPECWSKYTTLKWHLWLPEQDLGTTSLDSRNENKTGLAIKKIRYFIS